MSSAPKHSLWQDVHDAEQNDLRPAADGGRWSKPRSAVGDIAYDDGSPGILIYVKASMTGEEDTSVGQREVFGPFAAAASLEAAAVKFRAAQFV